VATQLGTILFIVIATAIVVAQLFILRSTARGMRFAAPSADGTRATSSRNATLEWAYAVVPAIALVVLLIFSWRTMHPTTMQVQGVVPGAPETTR
jgi:heme/copper-type cytochrome/quinol oxidase subunit 2